MIALLLLTPLLFWNGTVDHFEFPKVSLLFLAVILLGAAGLARGVRSGSAPSPSLLRRLAVSLRHDPLALGLLLFLVSATVSTFGSIAPRVSLFGARTSLGGLTTIGALSALFFATRAVCDSPAAVRALLVAPLAAGGFLGAYACLQAVGIDPIRWQGVSFVGGVFRPFATLGHANHLAGYLAMVLPVSGIALFEQIRSRRWIRAVLAGLLTSLQLAAVVLSLSRGAWIATGATLLALAGLGIAVRPRLALHLGVLLAAITATAGLLGPDFSGGSRYHAGVLERLQRFGESSRVFYWEAAVEIFREHPWTGSGLDTFQLAFLKHRSAANWTGGVGRGLGEWGQTPARAHSEPLQVLATQGVLGVAALVLLLAGLTWTGARAWRKAAPSERPVVAALLAGVVAFGAQAAIDFSVVTTTSLFVTYAACLACFSEEVRVNREDGRQTLARSTLDVLLSAGGAIGFGLVVLHGWAAPLRLQVATSILLAAALAAAITIGRVLTGHSSARAARESFAKIVTPAAQLTPIRPWMRVGIITLLLIAAGLSVERAVVRPLRADFFCRQGIQLMTAQPEAAVASLSWSTSLSPGDDFCLAKLGMAAEAVADLSKEPEQRLQALNAALRAFKKAVELVPENSYHYANLGRLLAKLIPFGRATPQASFEVIERGLAKDPNNADLLYDAANTALSVNDLPKADFYARNAVTRFPGFAPCQAQLGFIASMNNELERAGFLLRESLGGDWRGRNADQIVARGNLASVLLRLGRAEEALPIAREAAEGAPASADFRFNLARALELSGHRQAAVDEYRRLTAEHPAFLRARKALRSLEEISAEVDGRWEEKASKEAAITDATGDL